MLHVLDRTADLMEESAFLNGEAKTLGKVRASGELPRTALIIVDVQRDFCPPPDGNDKGWGALAVPNGSEVVKVINELREKIDFGHVVLTQDWHHQGQKAFATNHINAKPFSEITLEYPNGKRVQQVLWPDHCVENTPGSEFHPDLIHLDSDYVLQKGTNNLIDSYSAFSNNIHSEYTPLNWHLQLMKISRLVVVGLAYDYCVGLTAMDGRALGFEVIVYKPACRSVDDEVGGKKMTTLLRLLNITVDETSTIDQLKQNLSTVQLKPLPLVGEAYTWVKIGRK